MENRRMIGRPVLMNEIKGVGLHIEIVLRRLRSLGLVILSAEKNFLVISVDLQNIDDHLQERIFFIYRFKSYLFKLQQSFKWSRDALLDEFGDVVLFSIILNLFLFVSGNKLFLFKMNNCAKINFPNVF